MNTKRSSLLIYFIIKSLFTLYTNKKLKKLYLISTEEDYSTFQVGIHTESARYRNKSIEYLLVSIRPYATVGRNHFLYAMKKNRLG